MPHHFAPEPLEVRRLLSAVTTLYAFTGHADGSNPNAIELNSSNLYTATNTGIWELEHGTSSPFLFLPFTRPITVNAMVSDGSGNIFATTTNGSNSGTAAIVERIKGDNTLTLITTAYVNHPNGLAIDANGDLFGTDPSDGLGHGTIWELAFNTSTPAAIYTFTGGADGGSPNGITMDSSGDIFGVNQTGQIWELPFGQHAVTILYTFTGGTDGGEPQGVSVDANGDLFGTTFTGGNQNQSDGTAWELSRGASTLTTLYSFSGKTDGKNPLGVVVDSSGNLFGITRGGANNAGTYFEIPSTPDSTPPTAVAYFHNIVTPGTFDRISVVFSDNSAVLHSSTSGRPIYVSGPNGYFAYAHPKSLGIPDNGSPIVAGYRIYPPAGTWTAADNGTYKIWLHKNRVQDIHGNFTPGELLGTFTISVSASAAAHVIAHTPTQTPPPSLPFAVQPLVSSTSPWFTDAPTIFA